ncbi:MAG TPA: AraC family transcriptional regulator [Gemmatimonadaceae bacterium]|nr:AraC family transcriptional regulator [Gemmatimonadaceae bacterium]
MLQTPNISFDRPNGADAQTDVVSEVLRAVRLGAEVFGRFEVSAPWAMRVPRTEQHLSFYVIARGGAWLDVEGERKRTPARQIALSAGDVVLLPHGEPHVLRDPSRAARTPREAQSVGCPRPTSVEPVRFGGGGPVTSFVAGAFRFAAPARSVLLESLPPVIHIAAGEATTSPQVAAAVQLILAESVAPGPGSSLVSARLAEILLVHALRAQTTSRDEHQSGLCALADPMIGASLRLMHAQPAEPWTVERLARDVGMSRSAFAARFTQLVGEAPLQYLTRWRMTQAAELLREREDSVPAIAERVGYRNAAAFMKAFARVEGVGPGAYRRKWRVRAAVSA